MKIILQKTRIKAVGLVEVLVVLTIVGVTMIGAMQLTTQAFNSIRENEITDLASGFLIQGIEIAKSPQRVVLTNDVGIVTNPEGSYAIDVSQNPPVLFKIDDRTNQPIQSCENAYEVEITQEVTGTKPAICLQIIIKEITIDTYEITSRVIYSTRDGQIDRTLKGFRATDFSL